MPSQRAVALSLDEETFAIWEGWPSGERSTLIRAAMLDADCVRSQVLLVESLRARVDYLESQLLRARTKVDLKKIRDAKRANLTAYQSLQEQALGDDEE